MIEDAPPDQGQDQDAEQHADQSNVEPHVAIEDVTELVRNDALQLVAVQLLEGSARHGHRGIGGGIARGEGVDSRFLLQDVDLRDRHTGRQGDLLDHVDQAPAQGIPAVRIDEGAAEATRDLAAAPAQGERLGQAGEPDEGARGQRATQENVEVGGEALPGKQRHALLRAEQPQAQQQDDVDHRDDGEHRHGEQEDKPAGLPPGPVLVLEEIHSASRCEVRLLQNETCGTSRLVSSSISSSSAGAKLNQPAKKLFGKDSRNVL